MCGGDGGCGGADGEERMRKAREEKDRVETLACASSTASRSETDSTVPGKVRSQSSWRTRLEKIARRS